MLRSLHHIELNQVSSLNLINLQLLSTARTTSALLAVLHFSTSFAALFITVYTLPLYPLYPFRPPATRSIPYTRFPSLSLSHSSVVSEIAMPS